MIASTQITNTEVFALIAVLVFKLLSHKDLFIDRKYNRNCYKVGYLFKKIVNYCKIIENCKSRVNYCKIINCWNVKFSGYF